MQVSSLQTIFPAGGRQPFRLSPRRTPLFSSSPSRTRFGWFFLLIITPAFSRLKIGFTRGLHARLPAARADFYQRVRRLLTGGSLCPACALGGNRLATSFQNNKFCNSPLLFAGITHDSWKKRQKKWHLQRDSTRAERVCVSIAARRARSARQPTGK